jgi:hypothetical protein
MTYEIKKPKTEKEGLINAVKMIANNLERGETSEAKYALTDLIDSLSSECVRFDWMSVAARKKAAKDTAKGIAAFAAANPRMVD